jgi:hypothetical protein
MPIDEPSAANRSNWSHPVGIVEVFGVSTAAGLVVTGRTSTGNSHGRGSGTW